MRWANCNWYWTRHAADIDLIASEAWADGPWHGAVYSAHDGREFEASYAPDTRDRFAEQAGY